MITDFVEYQMDIISISMKTRDLKVIGSGKSNNVTVYIKVAQSSMVGITAKKEVRI